MTRGLVPRSLLLATLPLLGACSTYSPMIAMSPVRQDALQVRDIDAPPTKTFSAATNALVNAGYTIQVTDGEGGLLTAWRREDPSIAEHAAVLALTTLLTLGNAPSTAPPHYYAVCAQILPRPDGLSQVRICLYGHGNLKREESLIDDLWISMQRDLLARSPGARAP